jgi:hypothetical protein
MFVKVFGKDARTMYAIARAESGLQAGNKNYNCRYDGKSRACKPDDRKSAWSVDCGILQINVMGTICPVELFDIEYNLNAGKGKLERQGFKAWSVYKNKSYLQYTYAR